jgi:hypothetical protein
MKVLQSRLDVLAQPIVAGQSVCLLLGDVRAPRSGPAPASPGTRPEQSCRSDGPQTMLAPITRLTRADRRGGRPPHGRLVHGQRCHRHRGSTPWRGSRHRLGPLPASRPMCPGNAVANAVSIQTRVGSFVDAVADAPYDLVLTNPPYLPTPTCTQGEYVPAAAGPAWARDAGEDDVCCSISCAAPRLECRSPCTSPDSVRACPDRTRRVARRHRPCAIGVPRGDARRGPGRQGLTAACGEQTVGSDRILSSPARKPTHLIEATTLHPHPQRYSSGDHL